MVVYLVAVEKHMLMRQAILALTGIVVQALLLSRNHCVRTSRWLEFFMDLLEVDSFGGTSLYCISERPTTLKHRRFALQARGRCQGTRS